MRCVQSAGIILISLDKNALISLLMKVHLKSGLLKFHPWTHSDLPDGNRI